MEKQDQQHISVLTLGLSEYEQGSVVPEGFSVSWVENYKEFRRFFKDHTVSMVIFDLSLSEQEQLVKECIGFLKDTLNYNDVLLIILIPEVEESRCLDWQIKYGVHQAISIGRINRISDYISPLLVFAEQTRQQTRMEQIQKNLLATAGSFAHDSLDLNQTIAKFADLLSEFTQSNDTFIVRHQQGEQISFQHVYDGYSATELENLNQAAILKLVDKAIERKVPQIELIPQNSSCELSRSIKCDPGCYLSFPIIIYGKVVCLIISFLPIEKMDRLNISAIEVMKEACDVIRMIIERRVAKNKLKSQYLRTKAALLELNETKEQLIHNEKMATVGQIAAGIAHEINNPLAYVLSNFQPLDDYVDTLVKLIKLQDQLVVSLDKQASTNAEHVLADIEGLKVEADLEYLMTDIRDIVDDSRSGLLRVRDIISDLGAFAKQQKLEKSQFSMTQLVDETLRILKYELNDEVAVERNIANSDEICAHRGFIQQIMTNLIKNAAQAMLQDQGTDGSNSENKIQISVDQSDSNLTLKITDNGPGMSPEVAKRIFTPFFSTKDVGKGTGLGLSVSHNLAKKMGGELKVKSKLGVGTEFELSIPNVHA